MNNSYILYITPIILFACIKLVEVTNIPEYLLGDKYVVNDGYDRELNITFLMKEYVLEKRPERDPDNTSDFISPPYEMYVRAFLILNDKIQKEVTSLSSFEGYANIDTVEKAVEFVRFRTSGYTYFLFRPDVLIEVFDKEKIELRLENYYGGCSSEFFEKHNLKNLTINDNKKYYKISRFLLSFPSYSVNKKCATLYYVIEKVYKNGKYEIEKKRVLDGLKYQDIPYPFTPR